MKEIEKKSWLDFSTLKLAMLERVNSKGPLAEMGSWIKAYPEIDFPEAIVFEGGNGERVFQVDWEDRAVEEKMVFVALKKGSGIEVAYSVTCETETVDRDGFGKVASVRVSCVVGDMKRVWKMWLDGCFKGDELSEEAICDFVEFSLENDEKGGELVGDMDLGKISVGDIKIGLISFSV